MGRSKKKEPKAKYLDELLTNEVMKYVENRQKLLAPFPFTLDEVYRRLWTADEYAGIEALQHFNMLGRGTEFKLLDDSGMFEESKDEIIAINFSLPKYRPMPDRLTKPLQECFDAEERELITAWARDWYKFSVEARLVRTKVTSVAGVCTSWGQAVRLWPVLRGFVTEGGREKLSQAKATSRYPSGALESEGYREDGTRSWSLRPEYRPETFVALESIIAESLLLPLIDDLPEVAHDFSGSGWDGDEDENPF